MSPAVYMRNQMPCMPVRSFMIEGNHWSGPSSLAAVIHMQAKRRRNIGFITSLNISPVETFDWTRSVFGYSWPRIMKR